jgi:hypothetical protein
LAFAFSHFFIPHPHRKKENFNLTKMRKWEIEIQMKTPILELKMNLQRSFNLFNLETFEKD